MGFKSIDTYNDERYRFQFKLAEDKHSADVVFLYRSKADMLVAQAHYIKTPDYDGFVHCCGKGCPACKKGIKTQTRIFIPLYNINKIDPDTNQPGVIEFWDRSTRFEPQFQKDVFDNYANPSEYVFTITRHGVSGDVNTTYSIDLAGRNSFMSYEQILAKFNAKMPDYYENLIKDIPADKLETMIYSQKSVSSAMTQDYVPVPRAGYQSSIPDTYVNASEAVSATNVVPDDESLMDMDEGDEGEGELPPAPTTF